jgi:hypothetical protein
MAKYARDGSNARSKGRRRKEMTRFGSVRLERRRAIAKLKPVVKFARRRRSEGDSACSRTFSVGKDVGEPY